VTFNFNSWDEYYKFLTDCLKSDFISDTYLVYKIYNDNYRYADIQMVKYLLDIGLYAQEGFNKFLHVLLDGYKNAYLMKDDLPEIFNLFLNKGAKPNLDILFNSNYPFINKIEFINDEIYNYKVRAMIIDTFILLGIKLDVSKFANWKLIKKINPNDYESSRLYILKINSKYLQSNPRPLKFQIEI
jgi:hypothetical protein